MKWIFVCLILPFSLFAQYELAVCLIFQDDAPYLKEWIEFHKLQGVEHFYLYNNNSTDDFREILKPYQDKGEVTLTDWNIEHAKGKGKDWNYIQSGSYTHCLNNFGHQCKWLAIIDSDEFLFCCDGQKLPKFLNAYTKFGAVAVNWQMFGTSYIYEIPKGSLMIELLTRCGDPQGSFNRTFKSIVQPKYVERCNNPHLVKLKGEKKTVNADMIPVKGYKTATVSVDKIRINHYWTRTEKYLLEDKIPKRVHMYNDDEEKLLGWARQYNEFEDQTILQFVPKLKSKMK